MSLIGDLLDRLTMNCPSVHVDLARSLNALPDISDDRLPAAFVSIFDSPETPPNETIQMVTQRMPVRFTVLLATRHYDAVTGADQWEETRNSIFAAILGFQPNGLEPVEYVGGALITESYTAPVLWWRDLFRTYQYLRSST